MSLPYNIESATSSGFTPQERLEELLDHKFLSTKEPLLVKKLRKQLTTEQIIFVLENVFSTCSWCWDEEDGIVCTKGDD